MNTSKLRFLRNKIPCPRILDCRHLLLHLDMYWHLHCHKEPLPAMQLYSDQSMMKDPLIRSQKNHSQWQPKVQWEMAWMSLQIQNLKVFFSRILRLKSNPRIFKMQSIWLHMLEINWHFKALIGILNEVL